MQCRYSCDTLVLGGTRNEGGQLVISQEELDEAAAELEREAAGESLASVCSCGHPMNKHSIEYRTCGALKQTCDCGTAIAIARVPNARHFMYKSTEGAGAFAKGVLALTRKEMGSKIEYLIPWRCVEIVNGSQCGSEKGVRIVPRKADGRGKSYVFMCEQHR